MDHCETAINKLTGTVGKLSAKAQAVSGAVIKQLECFCRQNDEFAQAIAQSDRSVTDCLEFVVKGCGSSISDIECYRRAVDFWFPGAKVNFQISVDLGDGGFSNKNEGGEHKRLELSFDDLL